VLIIPPVHTIRISLPGMLGDKSTVLVLLLNPFQSSAEADMRLQLPQLDGSSSIRKTATTQSGKFKPYNFFKYEQEDGYLQAKPASMYIWAMDNKTCDPIL